MGPRSSTRNAIEFEPSQYVGTEAAPSRQGRNVSSKSSTTTAAKQVITGTGAPPNAMKVRQAGKGACHRTTAMKRETIIVIRAINAIVRISLIRIVIAARADDRPCDIGKETVLWDPCN